MAVLGEDVSGSHQNAVQIQVGVAAQGPGVGGRPLPGLSARHMRGPRR
jgi:hypothetical protein